MTEKDRFIPPIPPPPTEEQRRQIERMQAVISARAQLAEVIAGRPAKGWKNTFSKRLRAVAAKAEYRKPFEELFLCDHPEWKNPNEPNTGAWLGWELENMQAFRQAFEEWFEQQK